MGARASDGPYFALSDWRGSDGSQKTKLTPQSHLIARGLALSRNDAPPWFEATNRDAREMFPYDVTEILLENAKIRRYSDDWHPRDPKGGKALAR